RFLRPCGSARRGVHLRTVNDEDVIDPRLAAEEAGLCLLDPKGAAGACQVPVESILIAGEPFRTVSVQLLLLTRLFLLLRGPRRAFGRILATKVLERVAVTIALIEQPVQRAFLLGYSCGASLAFHSLDRFVRATDCVVVGGRSFSDAFELLCQQQGFLPWSERLKGHGALPLDFFAERCTKRRVQAFHLVDSRCVRGRINADIAPERGQLRIVVDAPG